MRSVRTARFPGTSRSTGVQAGLGHRSQALKACRLSEPIGVQVGSDDVDFGSKQVAFHSKLSSVAHDRRDAYWERSAGKPNAEVSGACTGCSPGLPTARAGKVLSGHLQGTVDDGRHIGGEDEVFFAMFGNRLPGTKTARLLRYGTPEPPRAADGRRADACLIVRWRRHGGVR